MLRRDFLRLLVGTAGLPLLSNLARALPQSQYPFSAVPAELSGITWTHVAPHSPQKYLPESTGAGCAFLDYDNDGWMDIYLVNSGPCDIFTPTRPLRNAVIEATAGSRAGRLPSKRSTPVGIPPDCRSAFAQCIQEPQGT